jgi:hypothetical protein
VDQEADAVVGEVEGEVACLVGDQAPVGLAVQPATLTRRLRCAMKNSA